MQLRKEVTISAELENGLTPAQVLEKIKSIIDSVSGFEKCELVGCNVGWAGTEEEHTKEIYFTFSIK